METLCTFAIISQNMLWATETAGSNDNLEVFLSVLRFSYGTTLIFRNSFTKNINSRVIPYTSELFIHSHAAINIKHDLKSW